MSNTASHDNHEKINSWVSSAFLYGCEVWLGGLELCYKWELKAKGGGVAMQWSSIPSKGEYIQHLDASCHSRKWDKLSTDGPLAGMQTLPYLYYVALKKTITEHKRDICEWKILNNSCVNLLVICRNSDY